MAEFRVPFTEEYYGIMFFEADNLEDAKQKLKDIEDEGYADWESLAGYYKKERGGGFEVWIDDVEELG